MRIISLMICLGSIRHIYEAITFLINSLEQIYFIKQFKIVPLVNSNFMLFFIGNSIVLIKNE